MRHSLRNTAMRLVLTRTIIPNLLLSIFRIQTITICLAPTNSALLPSPDCLEFNTGERFRHINPKPIKCVITDLSKIPLHGTPKVLYEVKFTVILWEKLAQMSGCLDGLLNKRVLLFEVRLLCKNGGCTACLRRASLQAAFTARAASSFSFSWIVNCLRGFLFFGAMEMMYRSKMGVFQG